MPINFPQKPGLIAYLTAGDPSLATTRDIALALLDNGAKSNHARVEVSASLISLPITLKQRLLVGCALAISGFYIIGCQYFPESSFELASDSRLPKWIGLPIGLKRTDASLTMTYYIKSEGRRARFVLHDSTGRVISKVEGNVLCGKPFLLDDSPGTAKPAYPAYEAITVNGVTDMVEHRKMEPIFYVTDADAVWHRYLTKGCE